MGQVTMQIKCRAHSAPEKERQHDRQIGKLETRQESDHPEQLQCDQDNENEKVKFFVLEHAAKWGENEAANRPRLNPDARVSHDNGGATNRYLGERTHAGFGVSPKRASEERDAGRSDRPIVRCRSRSIKFRLKSDWEGIICFLSMF